MVVLGPLQKSFASRSQVDIDLSVQCEKHDSRENKDRASGSKKVERALDRQKGSHEQARSERNGCSEQRCTGEFYDDRTSICDGNV